MARHDQPLMVGHGEAIYWRTHCTPKNEPNKQTQHPNVTVDNPKTSDDDDDEHSYLIWRCKFTIAG